MRVLCIAVLSLLMCNAASAGILYEMVAGVCTNGLRHYEEVEDENGNTIAVVGDLVCASTITVRVLMPDGYVPGTSFQFTGDDSAAGFPGFYFHDGFMPWHGQAPSSTDEVALGRLPANGGPGLFGWTENGGHFAAYEDRSWRMIVESAPPGTCIPAQLDAPPSAPCIPNSGEGANGGGYWLTGTYDGWRVIPEPSTALLGLAALLVHAVRRSHRRMG